MPRRVRNADLETREARRKLKARGKPYWQAIGLGLHIGYRKSKGRAVWVVRRYLGEQSYKNETFALADDVEDADGVHVLTFWQAQEFARGMRAPHVGAYTVRRAVADYLDNLAGRASQATVRARSKTYILPRFADVPVVELKADEIREWHREVAHTPRIRKRDPNDPDHARKRKVSANQCLNNLKASLNFALAHQKVVCAPVWNLVKPFRGVDIPRNRYLTQEECQRLLDACPDNFRILVRAALETGCRFSELARLRVGDFDRRAGTLHIRETKNQNPRHVILTAEACEFFSGLKTDDAFLLGRAWTLKQQNKCMREACKSAGLTDVVFHSMRHTWGSLSTMNGMPLLLVARGLGHTTTRMVDRRYAHLSPDYVADTIRSHAPRFGASKGRSL